MEIRAAVNKRSEGAEKLFLFQKKEKKTVCMTRVKWQVGAIGGHLKSLLLIISN